MGLAAFIGLVLCLLVVIAFAIYGMFLGLGTMAYQIKQLWVQVNPDGIVAMAGTYGGTQGGLGQSRQYCWDIKRCSHENREECPAFKRPNTPCWLANMQADKDLRLKPDCLACSLFNIPAMLTEA